MQKTIFLLVLLICFCFSTELYAFDSSSNPSLFDIWVEYTAGIFSNIFLIFLVLNACKIDKAKDWSVLKVFSPLLIWGALTFIVAVADEFTI